MTTSAIDSTSILNTTPASATPATAKNTMTGSDFIKVMLAQLQQQDPLNPQDSGQLLTQMSDIASLQTNQTLSSTLTGMNLQQSIGSGANMIGKSVQGIDATGASITGTVTSVSVQGQSVSLQLDSNATLPINNVTSITNPAVATAPATAATDQASAAAALANLLASIGGSNTATPPATNPTLNPPAPLTAPVNNGVTATNGSGGTTATN